MYISKSRLLLYLLCPRKYKYKYIDKIEEKVGQAAQIGLNVHEYAENVAKELQKCDDVSEEIILDVMEELYPFPIEDFETDEHAQSLYLFFVNVLINQKYNIFSIEGDIKNDKYGLRGIVDLVLEDPETKDLFIIDYKTGNVKAITQYRKELCIYRKLIEEKYPDKNVVFGGIFFTRNASYKGFNFAESQRKGAYVTEEDYNAVFELVEFVRQQIQEEYFPPFFNDYSSCKFCDYKDNCKADGGR